MILHIVNGDAFAGALRSAQVLGDILPWRDILHEGPVPPDDSLNNFYDVRAQFIARRGWASYSAVQTMFAERERVLSQISAYSDIVLWFDPDLYDQLQLLQVLNRLACATLAATRVSLVQSERPGVEDAAKLKTLFEQRTPVTPQQYSVAQQVWQAVTAPTPDALCALVSDEALAALPYLRSALRRYTEEFPLQGDGLSRTERSILHSVAESQSLHEAFTAVQNSEEQPFLGDTTFASYVEQFAMAAEPLVEAQPGTERIPMATIGQAFWQQKLQLTAQGAAVLRQQISNIALNGIDRHIGGVHLHSSAPVWYRSSAGHIVQQ